MIVYRKTFEEMVQNLRKILLRFRMTNLKINPKKYDLFRKQVKYLGHVVSAEEVFTEPEKTAAVVEWPVPQNKKQVRSFLGFCSYYRKLGDFLW